MRKISAAIADDDLALFRRELKKLKDPNKPGSDGLPPLYEACALAGDHAPDMVKALIEAGARVDRGGAGRTPVHAAAGSRSPRAAEVMRMLIEAGASIEEPDPDGQTALSIAARSSEGDPAGVLRALIAAKAKLDVQDAEGNPPLLAACVNGPKPDPAKVRVLLEAGADPEATGRGKLTAYQHCDNALANLPKWIAGAEEATREVMRLLREGGAKSASSAGGARDDVAASGPVQGVRVEAWRGRSPVRGLRAFVEGSEEAHAGVIHASLAQVAQGLVALLPRSEHLQGVHRSELGRRPRVCALQLRGCPWVVLCAEPSELSDRELQLLSESLGTRAYSLWAHDGLLRFALYDRGALKEEFDQAELEWELEAGDGWRGGRGRDDEAEKVAQAMEACHRGFEEQRVVVPPVALQAHGSRVQLLVYGLEAAAIEAADAWV